LMLNAEKEKKREMYEILEQRPQSAGDNRSSPLVSSVVSHLPPSFRVCFHIFPTRFECVFTSSPLVSSVFSLVPSLISNDEFFKRQMAWSKYKDLKLSRLQKEKCPKTQIKLTRTSEKLANAKGF
jgi:hypothetical protein